MKKYILFLVFLPSFLQAQFETGAFNSGAFNRGVSAVSDAGFSPDDLSGLQLWLLADDYSGSDSSTIITDWLDKSSAGNDATPSGTPQLIVNAHSGYNAVYFSNDDYFSGTMDTVQTFTFYIVYSSESPASTAGTFTTMNQTPNLDGWYHRAGSSDNSFKLALNGSLGSISNPGGSGSKTIELITVTRISGTSTIYLNGVAGLSTSSAVGWDDLNYVVGSLYSDNLSFKFVGNIFQILFYAAGHSDSNRESVENYLMTNYNLE